MTRATSAARALAGDVRRREFLRPFVAAVLVAQAAVVARAALRGDGPPRVEPRSTLAPGRGGGAGASPGPGLRVEFAAPRGEGVEAGEVQIVWNRPLRALDAPPELASPGAQIEPAVPGAWSWAGARAVRFAPLGGWPPATEFRVTVPAGLRALDGETAAEPFVLTFSTPRPRVLAAAPEGDAARAGRRAKVAVRFDQPVALAEVRRAAAVRADGAPVRFAARYVAPNDSTRVELVPLADYPPDADVVVRFDASLRGRGGPLPMGEAHEATFHTFGPLRVEALQCGDDGDDEKWQCSPGTPIVVRLSNRVRAADLKRSLGVTPKAELRWPAWAGDDDFVDELEVPLTSSPGATYQVRVARGLRDEHGQALAAPYEANVAFGDARPALALGVEGTFLAPGAPAAIPLRALNVATAEAAVAPLEPASLLELARKRREGRGRDAAFDLLASLPGAERGPLAVEAARNRPHDVNVSVAGARRAGGPVAVAVRWKEGPPPGGVRPGEDEPRALERVVQFTDLAVTGKVARGPSAAWVTRLSTGRPVADAELELWDLDHPGPVARARTDADGLARFDASATAPGREAHLFVRAGDERAAQGLDDDVPIGRYDVFAGAPGPLRGLVYADRGIYRPGDTVRLGGLVRVTTPAGLATPAGARLAVRVTGPEGEALLDFEEALSPAGAFARGVPLPMTAGLGTYTVSAALAGADGRARDRDREGDRGGDADDAGALRLRFEVAEYHPAEFQVRVEAERAAYTRGDEMVCRTHATLLSGLPVVNAPVRATVVRQEVPFVVPGAEGFVTDDAAYFDGVEGRVARAGEAGGVAREGESLDADGRHVLRARAGRPSQRATERAVCEAEVLDPSNQAVAGRAGALVHPASFYLGLKRASDGFARAGEALATELIAAEPDGKRLAGVRAEVHLIERRWAVARQRGAGAAERGVSTPVDRVVAKCAAVTAAAPVACRLKVPRAGHFVVRAVARDARKRPASASFVAYATGAGEPAWADDDEGAVELVPDRSAYAVGDVARVLVKSPFPDAEALVTVEREGVIAARRVRLSGAAPTVEVPVEASMVPNAYVGVTLVRGGEGRAPPNGPRFRVGYAPLAVDFAPRRLRVAVRPSRAEASPGERVEVEAELRDAAGAPVAGEVTIVAVDEGSLSLTDYRTPDPAAAFFEPRPLGVRTVEARADLGRVGRAVLGSLEAWGAGELGLDKGLAGGDGPGEAALGATRRDARQTAAFLPGLVADAAGKVRASFTLPETLTTFRVMAIAAAADDRAGAGEARVVTSKRLMVRAALPRALRVGDRFEAAAVVAGKGAPAGPVRVRLEAGGVGVLEGGERTAHLPERGGVVVRFPVEVRRAGEASFTFTAVAGADADSVEVRRPASAPGLVETAAVFGQTRDAAAESLGDFRALRDDVGGLRVGLSSSALVGVAGGFEALLDYPYGCSEQLTSRLVPLLAAADLARAQGVELPADPVRLAGAAVARLLEHQRPDGGFGLWRESTESLPWVSAYALWGLGLAERAEVRVPASALARARRYVARTLGAAPAGDGDGDGDGDEGPPDGPGGAPPEGALGPDAALAVDVLAENGAPDPGSVTRLFERRERLPLFAKALLLHALVATNAAGPPPAGAAAERRGRDVKALRDEVAAGVRFDGPVARAVAGESPDGGSPFDSPARTSAMVLRGLLAADPGEPLAPALARGLVADRVDGRWRTTHEAAWALLALADYRRAQEATPPSFRARAFVGREALTEAVFRGPPAGVTTGLPADKVFGAGGGLLTFDVRGSGTLFYEARLAYARREPPGAPVEAGFFVERVVRPAVRGAPRPPVSPTRIAEARAGDLVEVEALVATSLRRTFVAVDVPVPAGLEPVDGALATVARDAAAADLPAGPAGGVRRELRDERAVFFADALEPGVHVFRFLARATTVGDFVVPPARAHEMYAPEVYGATAAASFRVAPGP